MLLKRGKLWLVVYDWWGQWQNGRLLCTWLRSGDTLIRNIRGGKLVDCESFWVGALLLTQQVVHLLCTTCCVTSIFLWVDVQWIRANLILLSFPILSNWKFSFHVHAFPESSWKFLLESKVNDRWPSHCNLFFTCFIHRQVFFTLSLVENKGHLLMKYLSTIDKNKRPYVES
jgi:hypothetical protein